MKKCSDPLAYHTSPCLFGKQKYEYKREFFTSSESSPVSLGIRARAETFRDEDSAPSFEAEGGSNCAGCLVFESFRTMFFRIVRRPCRMDRMSTGARNMVMCGILLLDFSANRFIFVMTSNTRSFFIRNWFIRNLTHQGRKFNKLRGLSSKI